MSARRYRPLTADYPDIVKDHKFAGWVPTELQDCWYFYRHKQDEFNNNRQPSDFEIVDRMVRSLEMAEVIKRVQSDKNEDVGKDPIVYLARATLNAMAWPVFKSDNLSPKKRKAWRDQVEKAGRKFAELIEGSIYELSLGVFLENHQEWYELHRLKELNELRDSLGIDFEIEAQPRPFIPPLLSDWIKDLVGKDEDELPTSNGYSGSYPLGNRPVKHRVNNPKLDHRDTFVIAMTDFFLNLTGKRCATEVMILAQDVLLDESVNDVKQVRRITDKYRELFPQ